MDVKTIAFITSLTGAILLSSEAIGSNRAKKFEEKIKSLSKRIQEIFGEIIKSVLNPWEQKRSEMLKRFFGKLGSWPATFFILLSTGSLILYNEYLIPKFNEDTLALIGASSYLLYISSFFIFVFVLRLYVWISKLSRINKAIATIIFVPIIIISALMFFIGLIGTLIFSFPAVLIFSLYIIIYILSFALYSFIIWKDKHKLGNLFTIIGTFLTLGGIILGYFF